MSKSIPFPFNGIIQITGAPDVGKTTMSLEAGAHPKETCYIGSDVKDREQIAELRKAYDFGLSVDFVAETKGMTQLQIIDYALKLFESIPAKKYKTIIFDGWAQLLEPCFKAYVRTHQDEFRAKEEWGGGEFKHKMFHSEGKRFEARVLSALQEKTELLQIITHLGPYYTPTGDKLPGVKTSKGSDVFDRIPRARFWLRPNPDPTTRVPIALVLKRIDEKVWVDGVGLRTVSILPYKLTPNVRLPGEESEPNDRSLWDTIRRYKARPIDNREPLPEETPNAYELGILQGQLTEEQQTMLKMILTSTAEKDPSMLLENEFDALQQKESDKLRQDIERLQAEGKSPPVIAKEIGIEVSKVFELLA